MNLVFNTEGLNLLKQFEGCKLKAYQDQRGIWTVGYGHTGTDVNPNTELTQAGAENLLTVDLIKFIKGINQLCTTTLNDNQFSAIVCLAYNIGLTALKKSNTLRLINADKAPDKEWLGFCHTNGEVNVGLLRRRHAELDLFHTV